jgi:hypothetical protein
MRWKVETASERRNRLEKWRRWYAWYPVRIDGERVWLEYVYRRTRAYHGGMGDTVYETEYADALSMLRRNNIEQAYDGLE